MSKINDFISLGRELEKIQEEAYNLWSWLPSRKVAEKHHGDYADEFTPPPSDVMGEAVLYFAKMKYRPNDPLTEEEKHWFEECPCGEPHEEKLSVGAQLIEGFQDWHDRLAAEHEDNKQSAVK